MPDEPEPQPEPDRPETDSAPDLAYHVGELKASHAGLRDEWALHREEMGQLKGLVNTLLEALQEVEDVASEIVEEEDVEEAATVAEPTTSPSPEKRPHVLTRMLRGH